MLFLGASGNIWAQVMRLGPFDFEAGGRLEAVYSSNVEKERPSETPPGVDQEDYFFVVGLDLASQAQMTPRTKLDLDTGFTIEKHINREDLDNSSDPFGRARLSSVTELGRYMKLLADASYERLSESQDDTFVPGGRKKRDPHTILSYGAGLEWDYRRLSMDASYLFTRERHDEEEFQDGDSDETDISFGSQLQLTRRLSLGYSYNRNKEELVGGASRDVIGTNEVQEVLVDADEDDDAEWDVTQTVDLSLAIMRRPRLNYSFGFEKEDEQGEEGEWEPKHTVSLSDEYIIGGNLLFSAGATYTYEEDEEEDDISFIYNFALEHQLSDTAVHYLSLTREPLDTLGSTVETDSTTLSYGLRKEHLFVYNLDFSFVVSYEINEPPDDAFEETEKILTYDVALSHERELTRRLSRVIEYTYMREDSNVEEDLLEEHRVTIGLNYDF
jgi:hypothetical protein